MGKQEERRGKTHSEKEKRGGGEKQEKLCFYFFCPSPALSVTKPRGIARAARAPRGRPLSEARLQPLLRYPLAKPGGCGSLGKTRATVGRGDALRAPG
jgi:hypothetical protein